MSQKLWMVEWTYSPVDYFEEPVQISNKDYDLTIRDGKVEAKISHDPRPELSDQLDTELRFRFQGIQLISQKPYKLSGPTVSCRHAEGKRTIFLAGTCVAKGSVLQADVIITDKNGNIVADTRTERIERKQSLGALAAKYGGRDTVARKILQSYNTAVDDPDNCLVHLYEIRDALAKHFGRDKTAQNQLKVTKARWQELGRLANDAPLKQGRHRGKMLSGLRDATRAELDAAMNIAAEMVEKYLKHIDKEQT